MYTTLFFVIVAIIILDFALESYLDHKNEKNANAPLPAVVKDLYDKEQYEKQQKYFVANQKFGFITSTFNLAIILLMLFLFGFNFVDQIARGFSQCNIIIALIFFGILYYANDIISLPFDIYHTFTIEETFGFNKTTPKTFVADTIKDWAMTAVLGGAILALLIYIYEKTGEWFWILGWGLMATITIFMMMFYSNIIVPLFNKQTPLEDGELRTAIESFCSKVGYKLDNLYVIDGSKRSTKANAYFTGLGAKKRIVLYDTLMDTLSTDEIVAVLAHEIGHYKKKHSRMMLIISLINSGIIFFLLSLVLGKYSTDFAAALGSNIPSFHLSIIVFSMLYTPISTLLGIGINVLSRKNEYEADNFAKENGLGVHLAEALKKLSKSTLSNLTPHPTYVFFHYSHPTLVQRLEKLQEEK